MHNRGPIQRRKSKRILRWELPIGDGAPIAVPVDDQYSHHRCGCDGKTKSKP